MGAGASAALPICPADVNDLNDKSISDGETNDNVSTGFTPFAPLFDAVV